MKEFFFTWSSAMKKVKELNFYNFNARMEKNKWIGYTVHYFENTPYYHECTVK